MIDKILCICGAVLITCGVFNAINDEISLGNVTNIALGIIEIGVAFI